RLFVEDFAAICSQADRWNVETYYATKPKDERGESHEHARKSEGDVRTMQARTLKKLDDGWRQVGDESIRCSFVGFEQPGNQEGREGGAGIDGKIKPVEDARQQMLVRFPELIADICRNARFDSAGAHRDHQKADRE